MVELPSHSVLARARHSRDPRFDGSFFIAVRSTGIYCRSICPARPSTDVCYFRVASEAAAAGYRPCLRCRPEAVPGSPAWSGTLAVVRRALQLIDEGVLDVSSIEQLASQLGLGMRHLNRLCLRHAGALPLGIAQMRRLQTAKALLRNTTLPMTEIALTAGFRSVRRFNESFKSTYGHPPREWRGQAARHVDAADEVELLLFYRPPYDWVQVTDYLACHAIEGLERVDERGYARAVRTPSGHALIVIRHCSELCALRVGLRGAPPRELLWLSGAVRRAFDLHAEPNQIGAVLATHPMLAQRVAARPGLRIVGILDPFESCVRALLSRQVSVAAGRALVARLVSRAGERIGSGAEGLNCLFPTPSTLAGFDFATLGIAAACARTLGSLARAVHDGVVRFDEPTDEVMRALRAIPGLDSWTAQYVALRGLGDPDAFMPEHRPMRGVAAGGGPALAPQSLESIAECWRPWRGYALMHLWSDVASSTPDVSSRVVTTDVPRATPGQRRLTRAPIE